MPLNTTGPISIGGSTVGQSINLEFGRTATQQTSMSQLYRGGGVVPNATVNNNVPTSGQISLSNFYGAANRIPVTFTYNSNTQESTLDVNTLPGYTAGLSDVTITVNSGIYIWSDNIATPALRIQGAAAGDTVTLVNNGFIMGKGGQAAGQSAAQSGGPAISLGSSITINNTNLNAYIGGGGGGGGSAAGSFWVSGGGGAGGGASVTTSQGFPGVSGGSIGHLGTDAPTAAPAGAGGGRIFPGVGGAGFIPTNILAKGGGAGGGGGGTYSNPPRGTTTSISGGAGGGSNGIGGNSVRNSGAGGAGGGGGGGWGAAGGSGVTGNVAPTLTPQGTGGAAVLLNGNSVTFVNGDTSRVWGSIA